MEWNGREGKGREGKVREGGMDVHAKLNFHIE